MYRRINTLVSASARNGLAKQEYHIIPRDKLMKRIVYKGENYDYSYGKLSGHCALTPFITTTGMLINICAMADNFMTFNSLTTAATGSIPYIITTAMLLSSDTIIKLGGIGISIVFIMATSLE